jgi:phosphopantothenoylcysteine decarboxylase/phosphopantothenate--cysteine ligase
MNKRVLLGVTGGIAAYKSADLVRRLRDAGADVQVVMTRSATEFITPLTMQAVSGHPVHEHLLDTDAEAGMGHIALARWADVVLVAPASANFLARLTQGRAEDLLSAICLATQAPVAVAPAMNQQMWSNPATQSNITALRRRGIHIFGPGDGAQACGEIGLGRMSEPTELAAMTAQLFEAGALDGLTVVVTAGPTWEAIDPVRGITNKSSGKMGYAVAQAAMEAGAKVVLVSGPTALPDPDRVQTVRVVSAQEMHDAVHAHIGDADIFVGVAAVADYRPVEKRASKIKKNAETMTLELVKNPDIVGSVAKLAQRPFVVGFAAETDDVLANARAKLERKQLDLVAANRVGVSGGGFESDDNQLTLVERDSQTELPAGTKQQLARLLIQHIAGRLHAGHRTENSRQAHR